MSMKSIILFTTLFLVMSIQSSRIEGLVMAGSSDEDEKMEMGQSMRDMQALMDFEIAPSLRNQENQDSPDMQSRRLAIMASTLDTVDVTAALFRKAEFILSNDAVIDEMIQNDVMKPSLLSQTPLLLTNALVDDIKIQLLFQANGFTPTSKTLGERVEQALENFATTLGKLAPNNDLD